MQFQATLSLLIGLMVCEILASPPGGNPGASPTPSPVPGFWGPEVGPSFRDSTSFQLQIATGPGAEVWIGFPCDAGAFYQVECSELGGGPDWRTFVRPFAALGSSVRFELLSLSTPLMFRAVRLGGSEALSVSEEAAEAESPAMAAAESGWKVALSRQSRTEGEFEEAGVSGKGYEDGPSAWMEKVGWLLERAPLIAEPFRGF